MEKVKMFLILVYLKYLPIYPSSLNGFTGIAYGVSTYVFFYRSNKTIYLEGFVMHPLDLSSFLLSKTLGFARLTLAPFIQDLDPTPEISSPVLDVIQL